MHLQRFPDRASLISVLEGEVVFSSSTAAEQRIPGVQNPHWAAPCRSNASCNGWGPSTSAKPSTVTMACPSASKTGVIHDSVGRPSRITVQAPQSPLSQPCLEPVRPSPYRKASKRVKCIGTPTSLRSPLTVSLTIWVTAGITKRWPCKRGAATVMLNRTRGTRAVSGVTLVPDKPLGAKPCRTRR